MNYLKAISTTFFSILVAACNHPIEIIGDADVTSASGNRSCYLEDFRAGRDNCTKNTVSGAYQEIYFATPRDGWRFDKWEGCQSAVSNYCSFNIPADTVRKAWGMTAPPLKAIFRNAPLRDQGQIFGTNGFYQLGGDEWSQSITTGIKGQLAEIQIQLGDGIPSPTPTLTLSIVDGGNPVSGAVLFSEQLNLTAADLHHQNLFNWDLSSANLFFNRGDVFSFVLQADGAGYRIEGNTNPGYEVGNLFMNRVALPASDIALITYVEP